MKKVATLAAVLLVLAASAARAQEKDPLAMRILADWAGAGMMAGAGLGATLWLTDPANPDNNMSDQLAIGAAWGALGGAVFGFFILNSTAIAPRVGSLRPGLLHPSRRISDDPVAAVDAGERIFARSSGTRRGGRVFLFPLVHFRF